MQDKRIVTDFGPQPFVIDIKRASLYNDTYRTALWTGKCLQLTLMSIAQGEDIGLEVHPDTDQFIRIEEGAGVAMMGRTRDNLTFIQNVYGDDAVFVPAGTWHNIINTGNMPMKIYTIYAPPHHAWGTVQNTRNDPEAEMHGYRR